MAQWVSIWRAAQLAGVPRATLQQRVRAGEIQESEGLVSTESLLALYPRLQFEGAGLAERVAQIRDESFGRRVRERTLPSQEVLAQRLFRHSQDLADAQRHLQRYHELLVAVRDQVRRHQREVGGDGPRLAGLERTLTTGLARVLATESVDTLHVMDEMLKLMSAHVTVRPSGHEFEVEGRDTLLQGALRAGLSINYGCGNGSCGMCKVRVISGEVVRSVPTDYALSEAEKAQGYVLACAHTAASSEVTLETLEAAGPVDIPIQHITATVRKVTPLAPDTMQLHLQTPRTHRLRFLAGQSVTLAIAGGDGAQSRHPVASCPCDDRNLHFFLPRDLEDPVTTRAFAGSIKPGDAVTVWGPIGDFTLAPGSKPLVFVACDHGFAPVKSLIEHALSIDTAPSMTLFWLATTRDAHFLENQCRAWSSALDQFEYNLLTDTDPASGALQVGRAMRADVFQIDCDFYLAGPVEFVAAIGAQLAESGVPESQVHVQLLP